MLNWNHVCLTYADMAASFWLYVNGDGIEIVSKGDKNSSVLSPAVMSNMVLGASANNVDYFEGDIADVNIWTGIFSGAKNWTECINHDHGDYFRWDVERIDNVNIIISEESIEEMCTTHKPGLIPILDELTYQDVVLFCDQHRSNLMKIDKSETETMIEKLKPYSTTMMDMKCIWVGQSITTDDTYLHCMEDNLEGWDKVELETCLVLEIQSKKVKHVGCYAKAYGFCYLNNIPKFTLRGTVNLEVDRYYFFTNRVSNGNYMYQGIQKNVLEFIEGKWTILDAETKELFLILTDAQYPFGKNIWFQATTNMPVALSLDSCNPDEFNCNDGSCISLLKRCNKQAECKDRSDEQQCNMVEISHNYEKTIPPCQPSLNGPKPLILEILLFSLMIVEVKDAQSLIQVQFGLYTQWRDPRVTYFNLQANKESLLTQSDMQKLWLPRFYSYLTTKENIVEDIGSREVVLSTTENGNFSFSCV